MAKNKTKLEKPKSQDTPEDLDATEDDDLPPLPPLKYKSYITYPYDRATRKKERLTRQFVRYPYMPWDSGGYKDYGLLHTLRKIFYRLLGISEVVAMTVGEEPLNQDTPDEPVPDECGDNKNDDDLPPLPPLKGKFYTPNPNARPAKLHTTYPY